MTLLITILAAIAATVIWYSQAPANNMKIGILALIYWGAALMWLVDAVFEYAELKAAYFTPEPLAMLNDFYLGLAVVALGLIIWLVVLLIKDPKGVIRTALLKGR